MEIIKTADYEELSKKASSLITNIYNENPSSVMCLAGGSTPVGTYQELVSNYNNNLVSFKLAKAFFLDEYALAHPRLFEQSTKYFLEYNFFNKVNINEDNVFGIDQDVTKVDLTIKSLNQNLIDNPLDIVVLGIGENGHIGYNEPEEGIFKSGVHLSKLSSRTRVNQGKYFYDSDEVPSYAITLGITDIMKANKVILLASGSSKASAIAKLIEGPITESFPASVLKKHPNVTIICDLKAAELLK